MNTKQKLSDHQVSFSTVWKAFVAICVGIGSVFAAMNYYFAPRHTLQKEIGFVQRDISEVKVDVKWIRKVWEKGIRGSEVK